MYDFRPNTVIGFHGCDLDVRNKLVFSPNKVEISKKSHDWLGHGMYFWENNYTRAIEWAEAGVNSGKIKKPAVLGAILQLDYCCDFLDSKFLKLIKQYFPVMIESYQKAGKPLPKNINALNDHNNDKLVRYLDCAVIEFMHRKILDQYLIEINSQGFSSIKLFDSTRGLFTEGGPVFAGAAILEKTHIQICIRNTNCIKGFFIPRSEVPFP